MKKLLFVVLIVVVSCSFVFAGFNFKVGTSYVVTDIGASYEFDRYEAGISYYSVVPFVGIELLKADEGFSFRDFIDISRVITGSLYLVEGTFTYDLLKSDNHDLDVGAGIGWLGVSTDYLKKYVDSDFDLNIGLVALCANVQYKYRFSDKIAMYTGFGVPLAGMGYASTKSDGAKDSAWAFTTILNKDTVAVLPTYLLYTLKVGVEFAL